MGDGSRLAGLNVRVAILAMIWVLTSIAPQAQVVLKDKGSLSVRSDDRILNAPYSAKRHFTTVRRLVDGTLSREESGGSEARDSQGRTYSAGERHWTYFDGKADVLGSEMLYRIDDPVAQTETRWDTTSEVAKTIHWPKSALNERAPATDCPAACDGFAMNAFDLVEKLGSKTIGGFVAEGTRSSYTVPAGQDHNTQPIVVVHESWYCPELKIVVLETNDDPRSGTTRNELIDIARGEPDVTQYRPPADYVVHELQIPWQARSTGLARLQSGRKGQWKCVGFSPCRSPLTTKAAFSAASSSVPIETSVELTGIQQLGSQTCVV